MSDMVGQSSANRPWWQRLIGAFKKTAGASAPEPEPVGETCCSGSVHIAFRGKADDRMYIAYSRDISEVAFFRQASNIRVYCADCRRRVQ